MGLGSSVQYEDERKKNCEDTIEHFLWRNTKIALAVIVVIIVIALILHFV